MNRKLAIAIAGAGPIGMTLAIGLAEDGHDVTIFEQGSQLSDESRASTFHPSILDQLETYGVVDDMLSEGLKVPDFQYRERHGGLIAKFDYSAISDVTRYPYRLQLEQSRLTRIILARLQGFPNAKLVFDSPVKSVEQLTDSVAVHLDGPRDHAVQTFDYVVSADGASSAVRKSLGIAFEGKTYSERYLVVSTEFEFTEAMPDISYVNYVSDPTEWLLMLRTPNYWRMMFPIREDVTEDAALSPEFAQERLHGVYDLQGDFPVLHTTLYNVHRRVAESYRSGRVVLAGDAAHVNNPLGGLGMNSGLFDAFELRRTFSAIATAEDTEQVLNDYSDKQRAVSLDYVGAQTDQNWSNLRETDPVAKHRHNLQMSEIAADPQRHREYLLRTSMYKLEIV